MDVESFLSLLENAAMLIAMVLVFDIAASSFKRVQKTLQEVIFGILLGAFCVVLMLDPLEFSPGLIFDTRSILLGLTGLFFGTIVTVITIVIAVVSRFLIGGIGVTTGILVIITSAGMGMLLRKFKPRQLRDFAWYHFYFFGIAVNGVFLLLLLYTIPGPDAFSVLARLGLSIMILYPVIMTLVAILLASRVRREETALEMRNNVERLGLALSASGQGFYEMDLRSGEVILDAGFARILGNGPYVTTGNKKQSADQWLDMMAPEDRHKMARLQGDIVAGNLSEYKTEFSQYADTGERITLMVAAKVTEWDNEGKPLRLLGTYMDITGWRKSEEQAGIFGSLLDQSTDAMEVIDPESGRFLNVNETGFTELGYTREEFLKLTIFDVDPAVDHAFFREGARRVREYGSMHWQSRRIRKDGTSFPVDVSIKLVKGDRDYIIAVARDITEREKIREIMDEDAIRHRLLIEDSRDGIVILDDHGDVYEANRTFAEMLGYAPEEVMNLHVWDWDFQWDREHLLGMLRSVDERGDRFETRHLRKDGSIVDVEISTNASVFGDRKLVFCICRDITARKKTESELKLAALVYGNSREAMMVTDAFGSIVNVNPTFTRVTGYSAEEVVGKNPKILQSGEHSDEFYQDMWQSLNDKGYWEGEIWNRRKNNEIYPQWLAIHAAYDDHQHVSHWVAQFVDISERKQAEEAIWRRTNFDLLTGLPNRLMLNELLANSISTTAANETMLAFLSLDIDHFQAVNDVLGHDKGDMLLKGVAQRLKEMFRQSDVIARVSGDQFVVILGDIDDLQLVASRANEILKAISAPFHMDNEAVYISVSIGVTVYPADAVSINDLFKNAEQAMAEAKARGRNHFEFFTPEMHDYASIRLAVANDLREAMGTDQFHVAYQPVVDLNSGEIIKAEALIRWRHPERGAVSPAEFISIAEEQDLITDIDNFVFGEALALVAALQGERPGFQISVNKSPVDFQGVERGRPDKWLNMVKHAGLQGGSVILEITESLLLEASPAINELLTRYDQAGIEIALDDFGTGYSSLSYLRRFSIDYLKIDKSFVSNLAPDGEDLLLCEAIISMAHKLGLKVIAEGVEQDQHRTLLVEAGCDFGQGYLFSKPVSGQELRQLLGEPHFSERFR